MLTTKSSFLLGTHVEISLVSDSPYTQTHLDQALREIQDFEKEFSRFIPDSDLNLLNIDGQRKVSDRFIDIFYVAKKEYIRSNGYFNPLVQVKRNGYVRSFECGISEKKYGGLPPNLDMLGIGIHQNTITLLPGQELDFGGIGKGYIVDKIQEYFSFYGYKNFYVNAGGDIALKGMNVQGKPWGIGIENPITGVIDMTLSLSSGAVATSSRAKRQWVLDNTKYHHIINPTNHTSDFGLLSITIIGETCTECDIKTKSFFHLSADQALNYCNALGIAAIIYDDTGKVCTSEKCKQYFLTPVIQ